MIEGPLTFRERRLKVVQKYEFQLELLQHKQNLIEKEHKLEELQENHKLEKNELRLSYEYTQHEKQKVFQEEIENRENQITRLEDQIKYLNEQ